MSPSLSLFVSARSMVSQTYLCRRISTTRLCASRIDRNQAGELGLTEKEVVSNLITALTSNQMIAPSIWIDPNRRCAGWTKVVLLISVIGGIEREHNRGRRKSSDAWQP